MLVLDKTALTIVRGQKKAPSGKGSGEANSTKGANMGWQIMVQMKWDHKRLFLFQEKPVVTDCKIPVWSRSS